MGGPNDEEEADHYFKDEARCQLYKLKAEEKTLDENLEVAKKNLDKVHRDVAQKIGRTIVDRKHKYRNALDELLAKDETKYCQLEELAASIANTDTVQEHDLVRVPCDEKMQKAKVVTMDDDGQVKVSMWVPHNNRDGYYEEGYWTSNQQIKSFARQQVYAQSEKEKQTLTPSIVDTVIAASTDPRDLKKFLKNPQRPEFLMALYADAVDTKGRLVELGKAVDVLVNGSINKKNKSEARKNIVEVQVPSLKPIARATVKANDKYGGRFDSLTDIARMMFICEDVTTMITVLTFIHDNAQWTIIRIKDRLHRYHDPEATGGYRDMLLNVRDQTSGHIAEIQITFRSFFTIKSGGGHAVYKLARLLELNEEETTYFMGRMDKDIVKKIGAGLVHA